MSNRIEGALSRSVLVLFFVYFAIQLATRPFLHANEAQSQEPDVLRDGGDEETSDVVEGAVEGNTRWQLIITDGTHITILQPHMRIVLSPHQPVFREPVSVLSSSPMLSELRRVLASHISSSSNTAQLYLILSFHHQAFTMTLRDTLKQPEQFELRRKWNVSVKGHYLPHLSLVNHLLYALHHGHPMLHVCGMPPELLELRTKKLLLKSKGSRRVPRAFRQAQWNKYFLIETVLPEVDWIFWIDTDALFVDFRFNVAASLSRPLSFLSTSTLVSSSSCVGRRDSILDGQRYNVVCSMDQDGLNNGVCFFRGSRSRRSGTQAILDGVWATTPGRRVGTADDNDNSATIYFLRKRATEAQKDSVCVLPRFVMNSYPSELVAQKSKRKLEAEEQRVRLLLSKRKRPDDRIEWGVSEMEGYYRPGDWIVHMPGLRSRKPVSLLYFCLAFRKAYYSTIDVAFNVLLQVNRTDDLSVDQVLAICAANEGVLIGEGFHTVFVVGR